MQAIINQTLTPASFIYGYSHMHKLGVGPITCVALALLMLPWLVITEK